MGLSFDKQAVLDRLNQEAAADYEEAKARAFRFGRQPPPAPVPLTPAQVEFPKWLHKGWKQSAKGNGHHEPGESRLVHSEKEAEELLAAGWSDSPKKPEVKK